MLVHVADVSVRSLLLAISAACILWILRGGRTAALQHAVWAAVMCGMLALFAFGQALPRLPLRILDGAAASAPSAQLVTLADLQRRADIVQESPRALPVGQGLQPSTSWIDLLAYGYALVAFAFLARLATGIFLVRRLLSTARSVICAYESDFIAVPVTVGWLRPRILLPPEWRAWDRPKLDAVLAHEGAHARRRDGLVAALSGVNRCVFWFHPLAWMLERKLALLAEQACDESCVAALGDPTRYVRLLLEMAGATDGLPGRLRRHALTMAAGSHMRQRVESLLQEGKTFSRGLPWKGWVAVTMFGIPLVWGAGAVELDRQPALLSLPVPQWKVPAPPSLKTAPVLLAQQQTAPQPRATVRIDSTIVFIPVSVTDPLHRFVTGLDQDVFDVREDSVPQKIVSFSSDDAPLSIGIVFDVGETSADTLENSRQAVAGLFRTANPEDEAFLVEVSDRPELVTSFTHNLAEIQNRLAVTQSTGGAVLPEGVLLALRTIREAHNPRKALIVISNGGDDSSPYTESELQALVKGADVQIYAMTIRGSRLLTGISEPTGGRHFVLGDPNQLPDVATKIGIELRNQYLLGYSPSNSARDGRYRNVEVTTRQPRGLPQLNTFWRTGYYAPAPVNHWAVLLSACREGFSRTWR